MWINQEKTIDTRMDCRYAEAMKKLIELYLKMFVFWMRFPQKIRYLLVGGYNTVVSYALYALLLWMMDGAREQLALLGSFLISSINSFWTQKIFVFQGHGKVRQEYAKCLASWGVSYVMNVILLALFVDALHMNAYLGQFIALVIVTVNSYLMLKFFAFKEKK